MNKKDFSSFKPFSLQLNVDDFIPATEDEKALLAKMRPSTTFFKDGVKRFSKNWIAMAAFL